MAPKVQTQQLTGLFIYPSGDIYRGDYMNENEVNFRNGQGTYLCFSAESQTVDELPKDLKEKAIPQRFPHDVIKLNGQWAKDAFVEGEITFANGAKYSGKLEGINYQSGGTYQFPDGKSYTGEFFNNLLHGVGNVKNGDKETGNGIYKNNYGEGL